MKDTHTCSYYCTRPECIRRQRDELRGQLCSVTRKIREMTAESQARTSKTKREILAMIGSIALVLLIAYLIVPTV